MGRGDLVTRTTTTTTTTSMFGVGSMRTLMLAFLVASSDGFTTIPPMTTDPLSRSHSEHSSTSPSSTALYIIGPMIKRMRERNKKNQGGPLASDEERSREAPGLKVGTGVWKWPPVWPYASDFFGRPQEENAASQSNNPAAAMLMGASAGLTDTASLAAKAEANRFNEAEYWSVKKQGVTTDMAEASAEALRRHFSYYLRDGMVLLELGAAEDSHLPSDLKLSRHIGVGLNPELMERNPSVTEVMTVDLNKVVKDFGVESSQLDNLGAGSVDAIVMTNVVEFLTSPREVFKSCWRLLKPGGKLMVAFETRDAHTETFGEAQTRMWRAYNDDQHLWMAGSYFQFSVGDGWDGLKGFEVKTDEEDEEDGGGNSNPLDKIKLPWANAGPSNTVYICQATKATPDEFVDPQDSEKSFRSMLWMTPTMESRDKSLVAPRLGRVFQHFEGRPERQESVRTKLHLLPALYEVLCKMDQFAFPFDLQARLAVDLLTDPSFDGNEEQMTALKMGLGLKKPSNDFWVPVGQGTSAMDPEDRVVLLSYLVPRFGSSGFGSQLNDSAVQGEYALRSFASGIRPTVEYLKTALPSSSDEATAQLLATELLACEILENGVSRSGFASWLGIQSPDALQNYLESRKAVRDDARKELKQMRDARKAEIEAQKRLEEEFREQRERARKERSMVFNEATGKMELISDKK